MQQLQFDARPGLLTICKSGNYSSYMQAYHKLAEAVPGGFLHHDSAVAQLKSNYQLLRTVLLVIKFFEY